MFIPIQILLLSILGILCLYLAVLSVLALASHLRLTFPALRLRRFALVIPAHNEELSIQRTLESVMALDYPRDRYDVVVVADNCEDRTAAIARAIGAGVMERANRELRGKGYALRWCFDQLAGADPPYDAYVVVDADTVVSKNLLAVMNYYLEQGAEAIQCSDLVAPRPGAWSSEATRIGFTLYNYVRPLGRRVLGCPPGLKGNGMCFSAEVFRKAPWDTYSLNEDLEYGLRLLLKDIPVVFAPEATVLATMPMNPENSRSQRERWEAGRYPVIRRYFAPLLAAAVRRGSFKLLDALVELLTPALVNLMVMIMGLFLITVVLAAIGIHGMWWCALLWCLVALLGVLHMIIGLYAARADRALFTALLHLPRYALWKLMLYAKLARTRKQEEWVRTTREASKM